jgi:beta-propeller repeat-containing protein
MAAAIMTSLVLLGFAHSAWAAGYYPGVRLMVESRLDAVAYRFDVAPGADAGAIRTRYEGAEEVRAEDGGRALWVRAGTQVLHEQGLRCFQDIDGERLDVLCRYEVSRARDGTFEVAFAVGPYDRARALIIDPEIGWSSYLGGWATDEGSAIVVDSAGSVYVVGETGSSDFPNTGGFDPTWAGGEDAFVVKVNAAGSSLAWSSFLGIGDQLTG